MNQNHTVTAANDIIISPTYVPDLVNKSLDLLLDGSEGIFHITNQGQLSWADFTKLAAKFACCNANLIKGVETVELHSPATRPVFNVLKNKKGVLLPTFENALQLFLDATGFRCKENNDYRLAYKC